MKMFGKILVCSLFTFSAAAFAADPAPAADESVLFNGDFSAKPLSTNRHWGKTQGSTLWQNWKLTRCKVTTGSWNTPILRASILWKASCSRIPTISISMTLLRAYSVVSWLVSTRSLQMS